MIKSICLEVKHMKKEVITLENITYKNYVKVLFGLKVNRKQQEFVASNMCSLAEAYVALTNGYTPYPFAICRNGKPIGFLMIGSGFPEEEMEEGDPDFIVDNYCIWRLMIDKRYQGRGYGRKAMELALEFIRTWPSGKMKYCWLSYEPENESAKELYASFGFVEQPQFFSGKPGEEMPALLEL